MKKNKKKVIKVNLRRDQWHHDNQLSMIARSFGCDSKSSVQIN